MTKEYLPIIEIDPALVKAFVKTFILRRDIYSHQMLDGSYITIRKPLKNNLIYQHLLGSASLGAYALDANSLAQWVCLDADLDDEWLQLQNMASELVNDNIPAYLELSRRGGHLWLFTPKISGFTARQFTKQLLREHQIENIEIYPKQDKLKTGPGSLVRLPLGIHRKSGKRYHFIQLNGQPLAPTIREQMALLSNPQRVPLEYIEAILAQIPKTELPKPLQFTKVASADSKTLAERIKASISVRDFVSGYVDLNAQGVGLCPFHDDEHESFGVNEQGNYWHCWAGCGGGSIIDFWMKWRAKHRQDGSFIATITELAHMLFAS